MNILYVSVMILCLNTGVAFATPSGGHGASPAPGGEMNVEYMRAMDTMHGAMMTGVMDPNPDVAFVKGMIPHHEGAVEMARIELRYGKDPELRKLAEDIIKAQEKEITFMRTWLKAREGR